jgi:acyl-ACP thioesterase
VLRWAQDLAWYHSSIRGFDRRWYAERGLIWLVRAAEVGVTGVVGVGDTVTGTTQVTGWRRVLARRRTDLVDRDGTLVAWSTVDWVLIDGRGPTRIPAAFASFGAEVLTASPLARVDPGEPPPDVPHATVAVRPQELDPMDHVNNAVYADWVEERIIDAGGAAGIAATRAIPRILRLEYARAAERGATVVATAWLQLLAVDGWSCRIDTTDGTALLRARLEPGDAAGVAP